MTDQRRASAYEALHEAEDNFNADNSGNKIRHFQVDAMLKFADAERKAERERCAKVIREHYWDSLEYQEMGKKHGEGIIEAIDKLGG